MDDKSTLTHEERQAKLMADLDHGQRHRETIERMRAEEFAEMRALMQQNTAALERIATTLEHLTELTLSRMRGG